MKKKILALGFAALTLASCRGAKKDGSDSEATIGPDDEPESSGIAVYDFKWVTPTGAPTLAFYDQGANENWVSASNPSEIVAPSFAANSYDAIVFDGVSGLNLMTKNAKAANYKLARWINNLGFYVVSLSHTKEETATWSSAWSINGFVQTGNSSRAFLSLASSVWGWGDVSSQVIYETGVSQVASNIASNGYDFYVVADPVYTNLKAKMGDKLHLIYDMQDEWRKAHEENSIPSAALFVNASLYAEHQAAYERFLKETDERLETLVDSPSKAEEALKKYASENENAVLNGNYVKFGIAESIVNNLANLQKTNTFGFIKTGEEGDKKAVANAFNEALGGASFSESLFL